MKRTGLTIITKNISTMFRKHSPEILTGIGIAGMVTATVLAVKVTPKAITLIEEKKNNENAEKLTPVDIVKTAYTCYIPVAVTSIASITCLIGASSINYKRNVALAAACTISETAFKEYRQKVVETIGEKKEQTVRDAVAKEKIDKYPVVSKEVIITGNGDSLCFDAISGRYFRSNIDKLRRAEIEINKQIFNDMYMSLNDFYYEIGLDDILIGDELGWNTDHIISLGFSSQLAKDGTPCLVIDYLVPPKYGYRDLYF